MPNPLFEEAYSFDDMLLVPSYSDVLPKDARLSTRFSRDVAINIPLASAAMDTVTEERLAVALETDRAVLTNFVVCSRDGTITFRAQVDQWDHIFTAKMKE